MLEAVKNDRKNELFDYLNYLLSTELYPYAHQAKGHYEAKTLHKKISDIIDKLFDGKEKEETKRQALIENTSYEICELIDDDLFNYLSETVDGDFYLINFKVFQKKLSAKIKNILRD